MATSKYDNHIKIIVVGNSGVGKTCLISRFIDDKFSPSFITTIGIDFRQKIIHHAGKTICIQLWDTAGQERFRSITNSYYRGANGVIFVYDVTNRASFHAIDKWIKDAETRMNQNFIKILVGCKVDTQRNRTVSNDEGIEFAKRNKMSYFECSAKTRKNINEIFSQICDLSHYSSNIHSEKLYLHPNNSNNNRCC